ncbi:hypothetical protein [Mycolicibacterium fortuitum]|uniref:hypothetical protein n=1 Tax=Mycolicibacterium fortuitum TaxID=1766 RepID=UPI001C6444DC|nr:hypothetical protein [Mycolicibacterium fortuitum]
MRIIRVIDDELRILTAYRSACAADGDPVRSTAAVDGLLDERQRTSAGPASGLQPTDSEGP